MGKNTLERVPMMISTNPLEAPNQASTFSRSFLAEWKDITLSPKYSLNLSSA